MSSIWHISQNSLPLRDEDTTNDEVIQRALAYYRRALSLTLEDHPEFESTDFAVFQLEITHVADILSEMEPLI